MINYNKNIGGMKLTFDIIPADERSIDEIAFAYLVAMKCGGDYSPARIFAGDEPDDNTLELIVTFSSLLDLNEAEDHCRRNIEDKEIVQGYLGALDKADPHRFMTKKILASAVPA